MPIRIPISRLDPEVVTFLAGCAEATPTDFVLEPGSECAKAARHMMRQRQASRGLGDTMTKITGAIGIPPCRGCIKRAVKANRRFRYGRTA